jgi:hypothetical protein
MSVSKLISLNIPIFFKNKKKKKTYHKNKDFDWSTQSMVSTESLKW